MFLYVKTETAHGEPCHCCGTPCPTKRIVIKDSEGYLYRYGSTCAQRALSGRRRATTARKPKPMKNQPSLF